MSEGTAQAVRSLFVTLRRGYAGTPWFHRRILESLGLVHRHQCVEKPNNPSIRGMLSKVPHLVIIETDRMRYLRDLRDYHLQQPRDPWVLHHDPPLQPLPAAASGLLLGASTSSPSAASSSYAEAAAAAVAAVPLPPPPAPPRLTPFAAQQLREHVRPVGMEGHTVNKQAPQAPRKYFVEQARQKRAKVLTENGIFSAAASREHAAAVRGQGYRRRTGIRD